MLKKTEPWYIHVGVDGDNSRSDIIYLFMLR